MDLKEYARQTYADIDSANELAAQLKQVHHDPNRVLHNYKAIEIALNTIKGEMNARTVQHYKDLQKES